MKKKKILIGVSGGPDSMALLYTMRKRNPIVAHVNYKTRKSSERDEKIVRNFCRKNKIELHVKNAPLFNHKKNDNFQKWAREIRYNFFKEIYTNKGCKSLYLAHHQDDHIETYLIQKKRNIRCDYFGLKPINKIKGMDVKRILLSLSKEEIIDYCDKKKIPYGIDETNKSKKYLRNKIRHEIVKGMSPKKRKNILKKIKKENKIKEKEKNNLKTNIKNVINDDKIKIDEFNKLKKKEKEDIISFYVNSNLNIFNISKGNLEEIISKIKSRKPNILLFSTKNKQIVKSYEYIETSVRKKKENYDTIITLEDKEIKTDEIIYLRNKNKGKYAFSKKIFPLKVIKNNFNYKKANRTFIKNKIPFYKRANWPLLIDKNKNLLLVIDLKLFYNDKEINKEEKIYFDIEKRI